MKAVFCLISATIESFAMESVTFSFASTEINVSAFVLSAEIFAIACPLIEETTIAVITTDAITAMTRRIN